MYKVLARKYRPQNFDEFVGQQHVVEVLKKGIQQNKTAYAYIFAGPRGSGKTSMARVFAKALNCEKGPTVNPCNVCDICREITMGTSLDVIEIDGASNRGIDEIRALRENVNLRPSKARYKIYVIDEVHMLTTEAFNALLKTLEEPPEYVKFIFATTAPEKIPLTIISRCQRFDFRPLSLDDMKKKIIEISKKENFKIEEGAIETIYEYTGGSLRDALSIVDQLVVFTEGNVKNDDVKKLLGIVEEKGIDEILKLLVYRKIGKALEFFHRLISLGKDPALIMDGLIKRFKDIVFYKIEGGEKKEIYSYFEKITTEELLQASSLVIEFKEKLRRETQPVLLSELLLFKLMEILGKEKEPEEKESGIFDFIEDKKSQEKQQKQPLKKEEKVETEERKEKIPSQQLIFQWDKVLMEIKKKSRILEAAIREGKPEKFENGVLYILFEEKFSFHRDRVQENKKKIEKIISDFVGEAVRIETSLKRNSKKVYLMMKM